MVLSFYTSDRGDCCTDFTCTGCRDTDAPRFRFKPDSDHDSPSASEDKVGSGRSSYTFPLAVPS